MPVYAPVTGFADQRRHPRALLLIVGAHAVLIGAVMTAKITMPVIEREGPIIVDWIPAPVDPPPKPQPPRPDPKPRTDPAISQVDRPEPILPIPSDKGSIVDTTPIPIPNPGPIVGSNPDPLPLPKPTPAVVRTGPRFATPDWALRPPYPADKRRLEEEAVLKLRLTIDERGRVIAVDPVGSADRSFFQAARKHLMASWRYKPATEDGRPVASSTVITLRFELE
jgi:periplasmic protein TonB